LGVLKARSVAEESERVSEVGLHLAALHHRVEEPVLQQKLAALDGDFTYLIIRPGPANELSVKQAVALIP
jgi:hypothetical protein